MTIYLGSDHKGFALREHLKKFLTEKKYQVFICGNEAFVEGDDYPDVAIEVGTRVSHDMEGMGIVICGSGAGVAISANKVMGVRALQGFEAKQVESARKDDDCNVLALGSDFVDVQLSETLVMKFLNTAYAKEERFERRLRKIAEYEMLGEKADGCCGGSGGGSCCGGCQSC